MPNKHTHKKTAAPEMHPVRLLLQDEIFRRQIVCMGAADGHRLALPAVC